MKPTTVRVHWSESYFFPEEEQDYPFEEFERLAGHAARNEVFGYAKTKVTVFFVDPEEYYHCRLDLAQHGTHGFQHHMSRRFMEALDEEAPWAKEFLALYDKIEWPNKEEAPQ